MGGQRLGDRLPLVQEPGHLLLGAPALDDHPARPLAVRVEGRVAEHGAHLGEAALEGVDLALDLLEPLPELPHLTRRSPRGRALRGPRLRLRRARRAWAG